MKKKGEGSKLSSSLTLRQKAEEALSHKQQEPVPIRSESEVFRLVHELEVHQIELEMQKDELLLAKEKAEVANAKYVKLYEFIPSGYFILSRQGEIIQINIAGSQIMGRDRSQLKNHLFALFVSEESKPTVKLFLSTVFGSNARATCDLILSSPNSLPVHVHITGLTEPDKDECFVTMLDITKSKHAEAELNKSLALTEATLNSVHNGILVVNQNGDVLKTNLKFAELWHIPEEILASADDNTLLKSVLGQLADPDEFLFTVAELYRSPDESTFDHILFKDGRVFERISKPMYIEGKATARVWSFLEITARIKAETDLQKIVWKMENIITATQAGTWEWNIITGEVTINETWAQIIGYNLMELSPLSIETWQKFAHPDDLKRSDALLQEHFDGKLPYYDCECRMKHKDGHWVWIHDRGKLVSYTEGGLPHLMFGTHIEITQRKFVEEALKSSEIRANALLNAIPDLMFKLNKEGVYIEYKSAKEDLAYQKDSIIGLKNRDIMPFNFADFIDEKIQLTLNEEKTQIFEYQLQLPGKGICEYEARMVPCDNEEVIAIVRDITDRKKAESEIKIKNRELSRLVSEKDKLFSIIAHDLRSPFNGFLGLTEIMVDDSEDISLEELQELALVMRNSAKNVFRLLENLLEWARMEQGLIPFNPIRLNLLDLLSECLLPLQESLNRKEIRVMLTASADLNVMADPYMIAAVIRNLISNAIKFTQKEGEIFISAVLKKDDCIKISVKDSGIGMNPEMAAHLFELSAKNGRKGTAGEPSTGLGLIICKEFVEKHLGRIWVESVEAMGSTFYFTLPHNTDLKPIIGA